MKGSSLYVDESSIITFKNQQLSSERDYKSFARVSFLDTYPKIFYLTTQSTKNNITTYSNQLQTYFLTKPFLTNKYKSDYYVLGKLYFDKNFDVYTYEELKQETFESSIEKETFNFYSIGGNVTISMQTLESLVDSQEYVRANSYFLYPSTFYASQRASYGGAYFYNLPLITNLGVLFQSDTSTVLIGEKRENNLVLYNGKYYFYDFQVDNFKSKEYSGYSAGDNPPSLETVSRKYLNISGTFHECKFVEATSTNYPYIYSNDETNQFVKVLTNGAYIDVNFEINDSNIPIYYLNENNLLDIIDTKYKFGEPEVNNATVKTKTLIKILKYENNEFIFWGVYE